MLRRGSAQASGSRHATGRRVEDRLARRGGAIELLRAPAALYAGLLRARNRLYDRRLLPAARLGAAVVSVGNLTAGGTGKTPMVAWLARELDRRGRRVGVLSRGYGAPRAGSGNSAAFNEEGELLARLLPGVPHVQDPDRVRGGQELVRRGCDCVLLDDGFQHRRLARDLDLVLVDATRPWGLAAVDGAPPVRAVLPRGLLREPPSGLARADAIVLTRADQAGEEALARLEEELSALAPGKPLARAAHRPSLVARHDPRGARVEALHPAALAGRPVALVSAVGNPEAFERTARDLGADVRAVHRFPDHHRFTREEVAPLARDGALLLATAKDAVKLERLGQPFLSLEVEWTLHSGAPVLEALLDALPPSVAEGERRALHEGLHG